MPSPWKVDFSLIQHIKFIILSNGFSVFPRLQTPSVPILTRQSLGEFLFLLFKLSGNSANQYFCPYNFLRSFPLSQLILSLIVKNSAISPAALELYIGNASSPMQSVPYLLSILLDQIGMSIEHYVPNFWGVTSECSIHIIL